MYCLLILQFTWVGAEGEGEGEGGAEEEGEEQEDQDARHCHTLDALIRNKFTVFCFLNFSVRKVMILICLSLSISWGFRFERWFTLVYSRAKNLPQERKRVWLVSIMSRFVKSSAWDVHNNESART